MNYCFLLGVLLAGAATMARAQSPLNPGQPWGSWGMATVQLPGSPAHRWGGYAEVQARSNELARRFFYYELKGGVSFDIDPNFTVLLGGGRYSTADYDDLGGGTISVEKRLWEQLVLTQYSHRLKLEHRYRIEQRWFSFRDDSSGFRQRMRYRLSAFFPLNKASITTGTVFLSAYDEIFLNPRGPVLERNRIYAGVGYQLNKKLVIQAGYLYQANYNYATSQGQFILQNTAAKNNLVLGLTYKLGQRAQPSGMEKLPSQQD